MFNVKSVVLAAIIQGNRSNCCQFASSKRLDWLVNRLEDSSATGTTGQNNRGASTVGSAIEIIIWNVHIHGCHKHTGCRNMMGRRCL